MLFDPTSKRQRIQGELLYSTLKKIPSGVWNLYIASSTRPICITPLFSAISYLKVQELSYAVLLNMGTIFIPVAHSSNEGFESHMLRHRGLFQLSADCILELENVSYIPCFHNKDTTTQLQTLLTVQVDNLYQPPVKPTYTMFLFNEWQLLSRNSTSLVPLLHLNIL